MKSSLGVKIFRGMRWPFATTWCAMPSKLKMHTDNNDFRFGIGNYKPNNGMVQS